MDSGRAGPPFPLEDWYQQRRDQILQAFLRGELDETSAARYVLALRLDLARVRQLEQTFGPAVAEAVWKNVEVPVPAAEEARRCATCGASGAAAVLPIFAVDQRCAAEWPLCAPCWRYLALGFTRLRPGDDLEDYTTCPPFPLTDAEVCGYIAAGRAVVGRQRKRS